METPLPLLTRGCGGLSTLVSVRTAAVVGCPAVVSKEPGKGILAAAFGVTLGTAAGGQSCCLSIELWVDLPTVTPADFTDGTELCDVAGVVGVVDVLRDTSGTCLDACDGANNLVRVDCG